MRYFFQYHKDKRGGYWGEFLDLPGCRTQATTLEELEKMAKEALELYLDDDYDFKCNIPLPKKQKGQGFYVAVNPSIAFPILLRKTRLQLGFTQQEMAQKLGLESVGAYQRLETLYKSNPRLSTIYKISKILGEQFTEILKKVA